MFNFNGNQVFGNGAFANMTLNGNTGIIQSASGSGIVMSATQGGTTVRQGGGFVSVSNGTVTINGVTVRSGGGITIGPGGVTINGSGVVHLDGATVAFQGPEKVASLVVHRTTSAAARVVVGEKTAELGTADAYHLKLLVSQKREPPTASSICVEIFDPEGARVEICDAEIHTFKGYAGGFVFPKPVGCIAMDSGTLCVRSATDVKMDCGVLTCAGYDNLRMDCGTQQTVREVFEDPDLSDSGPESVPFFLIIRWTADEPVARAEKGAGGAVLRMRVSNGVGYTVHVRPNDGAAQVAVVKIDSGVARAEAAESIKMDSGEVKVGGRVRNVKMDTGTLHVRVASRTRKRPDSD